MTERPTPLTIPGWQRWFLLFVVGAATFFVFRRLDASLSASIDQLRSASSFPLIVAFITATAAMVAIASGWVPLLRAAGHTAARRTIVSWYFAGEITKYVPGGVWALVGRGEFAARDIGRRASYRTVTQSLLVFFASGSIPAAAAIARHDQWSPAARGLIAVAALGALPATLAITRVPARRITGVVGPFAVAWLAIGTTTVMASRALDIEIDFVDAISMSAAAWVVGFVVVVVPGGIGVREATFVALASASTMTADEALAVAVVCRFMFVLADTVGAAIGFLNRRPSEAERLDDR